MAVRTLQAPAPQLPLRPGMVLKLEAIDVTTGLDVTGVTCTRWSIYGRDLSPTDGGLDLADVLPEWVPAADGESG